MRDIQFDAESRHLDRCILTTWLAIESVYREHSVCIQSKYDCAIPYHELSFLDGAPSLQVTSEDALNEGLFELDSHCLNPGNMATHLNHHMSREEIKALGPFQVPCPTVLDAFLALLGHSARDNAIVLPTTFVVSLTQNNTPTMI